MRLARHRSAFDALCVPVFLHVASLWAENGAPVLAVWKEKMTSNESL